MASKLIIDRIPPDMHIDEKGNITWTPRLIDFNAIKYSRGHTVTADEFNTELIKQTYQGNYNTDTISVLVGLYNDLKTDVTDTANTANTNASEALAKAIIAEYNSTEAVNTANDAFTTSTEALSDVQTAVNASVNAITTAENALNISESAMFLAENASDRADVAILDAEEAVRIAETADDTSVAAEEKAAQALSISQLASSTANSANTKSDNAVTSANQAVNTANNALERVVEQLGTQVTVKGKLVKVFDADSKVDKENGKSLTTNDYTNAEKQALTDINGYVTSELSLSKNIFETKLFSTTVNGITINVGNSERRITTSGTATADTTIDLLYEAIPLYNGLKYMLSVHNVTGNCDFAIYSTAFPNPVISSAKTDPVGHFVIGSTSDKTPSVHNAMFYIKYNAGDVADNSFYIQLEVAPSYNYWEKFPVYQAYSRGAIVHQRDLYSYAKATDLDAYLPLSGGTMQGILNMNNLNIESVYNLIFTDPGKGEGLQWNNGNGWQINECPDDLSNTKGNIQFIQSNVRKATIRTDGSFEAVGSANDFKAGRYCYARSNSPVTHPYHRFAYSPTISNNYYDAHIILLVSAGFSGGSYGILELTLRTNVCTPTSSLSSSAPTMTARWLCTDNFDPSIISWNLNYTTSTNSYGTVYSNISADVFIKISGTYMGYIFTELLSDRRGNIDRRWTLVNSYDNSSSDYSQCWDTQANAALAIRGSVAEATGTSVRGGQVNNASWAGNATTQATTSNGTAIATTAWVRKFMLDTLYPVGTVYLSTTQSCAPAALGGTWTAIAEGYALWTTTTASTGGKTIEAGLPQISGGFRAYGYGGPGSSGAFGGWNSNSNTLRNGSTSGYNYVEYDFYASRSSEIYSKSNTVQPPAYRVYAYRRTA